MIETKDVKFQYYKKSKVFSFPDISLKENENLVILGKSGIGKTTLLHLLSGLLKPSEGKIEINNTDISTLSSGKLDNFRGSEIGLVFQKKYAIQSLSVYDNLKARLFFSGNKVNEDKINDLLEELDLGAHKKAKTTSLSEGQLQRLGVAMSVIHSPKLILADEPTSSLDDENCKLVIDLLINQSAKNKSNLIVITHDKRIKSFFQNTIVL